MAHTVASRVGVVGAAAAAAPAPIVGHIPGFRRRVAECNEITTEDIASYVPLVVGGVSVGLMQDFFAEALVRRKRKKSPPETKNG